MLAGTLSVATILINFPDKTNTKTRAEIHTLVFTEVNEYWKEVSRGKISLKGTTTSKWYTVQSTMASHAADWSAFKRLALIGEAITAADSEVNFKDCGYIIIVHAGDDQARSGKTSDMWSFGTIGTYTVDTKDGALALGISVVSEMDPVGPIAHEMGHNFGLPDLWDFKYDFSKGYPNGGEPFVGEWCLMGHGLWAGNGLHPTHPSSFCKIKLGWIPDTQIQNVGIDENKDVSLTPLSANSGGILVVRVALTDTTYYLVEARKRVGRDSNIPGEGIIIYYVDLTKEYGPVRVRSKTPPYPDTGAWQSGDVYSSQETAFRVVVMSGVGGGYKVAFGTAAQPPVTAFTVTVQAPYGNLVVTWDGKSQSTDASGKAVIQNVTAGQHTVSIQTGVDVAAGTRRGFVKWDDGNTQNPRTLTITSNLVLTAIYRTEHRLNVISKYGNITGAGWYEYNSTATITVAGTVIDHNNGTRRVFTGWSGGVSGTDATMRIVMTGPKDVTVNWAIEYQLKITSTYGNPQGSGWYRAGTTASYSVTSPFPIGDATRYMLLGWSGESTSTSARGTMLMDRPRALTATWKAQYIVTLQFQDAAGVVLRTPPSKVMLASPNASALPLTNSPGYSGIWLDEGTWILKQVIWHGVDVKKSEMSYNPKPRDTWRIQLRVYSLTVKVTSSLTGWTVAGAKVSITLPDGDEMTNSTDGQGVIVFSQLPAYDGYSVGVSAQGLGARATVKLSETTTKPVVVSTFLLTDVLMVVAMVAAIGAVGFFVRRRRGSREPAIPQSLHPSPRETELEKTVQLTPIASLLNEEQPQETAAETGTSLEDWVKRMVT
jgi:M6 family metalloprotease-like protein